ncbi:uncharacterized protein LOC111246719 isoform X2 [Varroa destructor]|nr:uncharacterized protein LOC111246719 isoform X2 [Varroa destructor]XP_022652512.1 uncharacterized protein LOC111246719 isoform X2 [Varroa destructor]
MPNLSVVGPLDVLRQKMILDMMEQRMKNKINANNEFLSRLGKRGGPVTASTPTILDLSNTAAIDTFQQLAFLTSLVKKRRRRSLADSTLFSAPSIQVWLNDQRRLAGRYTKSNGNRQSSRVFRLDLRTYGTVPKSPTLKTEPYVLSDDATTKAPYTSNFVSTKLADSEPTTGSLTEPGPTTWSPSLQGYVDDCSSPVNALRRDHPNHFAKNTTIFFSMRSEAEERFLREIISGRNHVSSSKTNITTATSITDESGDDWSDNTSATREISQQIDETTTDHTEFRFTLPESTSNAKTSAKHGQLVDGISQQEHQRQFTTETAFMFHETSESDFVESFEEQKTTFNERGVSEKVKILPASDNFELSSHSTTEINESSFDYSVSTLLSEIPTKTIHRPVENMTDWPVVSIVTSVSELITTKKEEKLPIAFVDHNDITTTESAATKQTVINPSPVISVKTVLRNIAKLPPEHAHAIQFDSSSSMVSPGYVAKNQNSSAGHPIRPIIIGSFEFSFDSNNDAKQRSNRPKAFTKNDAVAVKRQYASQSQVFYEKEGSLERITDTRDIGQNHTSKTISFLTTEHVLQATTSASNLHALSTTLPSITTPMPGLKPAILKADVTKALHEVRAFDDSDESNKSIERLTVKHNKKPLSDSPTQIRTQTSISLNELGEPFNPETRVVYDSKMTPTVEEVKTVKKKQTFLIGHTWTGNKNTSKKNKETISNSPTQRPMEEAFTKVNKVSSKPTSNLASHENHNDDVNEIFKSLRENDQDGCIQRAICEYEAMKRTKTLNIMEESFVDLFG